MVNGLRAYLETNVVDEPIPENGKTFLNFRIEVFCFQKNGN